jgi:hypothetical protein
MPANGKRHTGEETVMRHRLYYVLPGVEAARGIMNELLLARIDSRCIHFITDGRPLPDDLPEASLWQKTDLVRGAEVGMAIGAVLGLAFSIGLLYYFDIDRAGYKAALSVGSVLIGMLLGAWACSMQAASMPNSRHAPFLPELEKGNILLSVDVPSSRVDEIENLLASRHPEMRFRGEESHIPTFP